MTKRLTLLALLISPLLSFASLVTHNGVAFNGSPGGGSTVYLHQNGSSGSGALLWKLDPGDQPLSYTWTPGLSGLDGSTAVFNQGEVVL